MSDNNLQDVESKICINAIGLVREDGKLMEPIDGGTSRSWFSVDLMQEEVLRWVLQDGQLFHSVKRAEASFVELIKCTDGEGHAVFWGYAGFAFPEKQQHPSEARPQWAEALSSKFPEERYATVHLQARRDLVHTLVAPPRIRIWLHAFRCLNAQIWLDIGSALQDLDLNWVCDTDHVVHKLRDRLVYMFKQDQDSLFSAIEPHARTAESTRELYSGSAGTLNQKNRECNWHTDEFTSLMHMAITFQGDRTLGLVANGEFYQLRQAPGMVYLGNAAAYHHAVYDHEEGTSNFALQCRLGFPAWAKKDRPSPWGRHGFNPWAGNMKEAVKSLSPTIAVAFRESVEKSGGIRLPDMHDLAEATKRMSEIEHALLAQ